MDRWECFAFMLGMFVSGLLLGYGFGGRNGLRHGLRLGRELGRLDQSDRQP